MTISKKALAFLILGFLLISFIFACSKKENPTEPTPQKHQFDWMNESFTVSAGHYASYYGDLEQSDSLDVEILLLQGDYIGQFLIADEVNYLKWKSGDPYSSLLERTNSTGGDFKIVIPSNGTYYFVIYNTALVVTIEVQARITVTRWN